MTNFEYHENHLGMDDVGCIVSKDSLDDMALLLIHQVERQQCDVMYDRWNLI